MRVSHRVGSRVFTGMVPVVMMVLALTGGCSSSEDTGGDITAGLWAGSGGPETFYWEFWSEGGGFGGVVHTVREGRKETELPLDSVSWDFPALEMHMAVTGVVYRGRVDFGKGRISGRLFYGTKEGPEMELRFTRPDEVPGLYARPKDAPAYVYSQPAVTGDGWATADCRDFGLAHEAAAELVNAICAGEAGVIHSLLLVMDGHLVVEEYFHGYERDDLHRLASATKSVSSLLVGIAIDQGKISGVDAPVLSFFPTSEVPADVRWRSETLHHLLSMSMGLDWGPEDNLHGTGPEFFQQVLARKIIHEPGTRWAYHSANVNLLAGVIKGAAGRHADLFAEENLFRPLGITAYDWSFMAEDGYRLMDGSLQLRPRDMAKLGMLLRNEGNWQGRQVVSADWIQRSTSPQIATDGPEKYGYLWWLSDFPGRDGMQPVVFANGRGSQLIAWFPGLDLILVVTGGNEDNGKQFAIAGLIGRHF